MKRYTYHICFLMNAIDDRVELPVALRFEQLLVSCGFACQDVRSQVSAFVITVRCNDKHINAILTIADDFCRRENLMLGDTRRVG